MASILAALRRKLTRQDSSTLQSTGQSVTELNDIEVHPLFAREKFFNNVPIEVMITSPEGEEHLCQNIPPYQPRIIEQRTYEQITDALQLCSLWLELSLPFFCKIVFAGVIIDPIDKKQVLDPDYRACQSDIDECRQVLLDLGGRLNFFTKINSLEDDIEVKTIAAYHAYDAICDQHHIVFNSERAIFSDSYRSLSPRSKRVATFSFAHTVLHEITHAMYQCSVKTISWPKGSICGTCLAEVKFSTCDTVIELGQAWEVWAFGLASLPRRLPSVPSKNTFVLPAPYIYKGMHRPRPLNKKKVSQTSSAGLRPEWSMPTLPSFNQSQLLQWQTIDVYDRSKTLDKYLKASAAGSYTTNRLCYLRFGSHGKSQEEVYCDRLKRQEIYQAVRAGLVTVSISDGASSQIPRIYANIYKNDPFVQAFNARNIRSREAPF